MRSFVAYKKQSWSENCKMEAGLTPNGHKVMLVTGPVHVAFSGGEAANVSPATAQSMGQADAVIVNGGRPESKIGDGRFPPSGFPALKTNVVGSPSANAQLSVASNSRSTASGCCAFCFNTFWLRAMSYA